MSIESSVIDIAKSIGYFAPLSHQAELRLSSEQPSLSAQAKKALRQLRFATLKDPPPAADLARLLSLSVQAYSFCTHPVRSDLLADHIELLSLLLHRASPADRASHLSLLSLTLPAEIDHSEALDVLAGMVRSTRFSSIEFARRLATSLGHLLQSIPHPALFDVWSFAPQLFTSSLAVSTSLLFPGGVGHVSLNMPVPPTMPSERLAVPGHTLLVTNAPTFKATLTLHKDRVSFFLDRSTFVTVAALLLEEPASIGNSYTHASIAYPHKAQSSILRSGNWVIHLNRERFAHLQALFDLALNSRNLTLWRDFRAEHFGDI